MRRFTVPPFSITRGASRPASRRESGETSGLCQIGVLRLRQPCELGARADAELPVDAGEGGGHRVLGEKERSGDLAVRAALGDERGDPAFRGRQALDPCAAADRPELGAGLLRPPGRPAGLEALEGCLDRLPGRALLPRPSSDTPSAKSARARPNRSPIASCSATAPASSAAAASGSPRAAATRPRQRRISACTPSRPSAPPPPPRNRRVRRRRPASPDREQGFGVVGPPPEQGWLLVSVAAPLASAAAKCAAASCGRPPHSSTSPSRATSLEWTDRGVLGQRQIDSVRERARSSSPR